MAKLLHALHWYYTDELEAAGGRSLLGSKRGRPARNATASGATEAALAPPAFEGFECDGGRNHVKLLQRYTWLGLGLGLGLGLANPNPNPNPNQVHRDERPLPLPAVHAGPRLHRSVSVRVRVGGQQSGSGLGLGCGCGSGSGSGLGFGFGFGFGCECGSGRPLPPTLTRSTGGVRVQVAGPPLPGGVALRAQEQAGATGREGAALAAG